MRNLHRLCISLASQKKINSTIFDRVTTRRKVWFASTYRTLLLFSCIHTASRLSSGYNLPYSIFRYRTSAAASTLRTFQSTSISAPTMVDRHDVDDNDVDTPKTRKRRSVTTTKPNVVAESQEVNAESKKKRRSATSKATSTIDSLETNDAAVEGETAGAAVLPKKGKTPAHQVITEKDELPKLWTNEKAAENGSYSKFSSVECFSTFFVGLLLTPNYPMYNCSISGSIVERCWITSSIDEITECFC